MTKRTTFEVLESIERNSADTLDLCTELLQRAKAKDDTSGEVSIGGFRASITKEFWSKYGKWVLAAVALTGWGSKILSLFHRGGP